MDYIFLISGLVIGGVVAWLLLKSKVEFAYEKGKSALEAEAATLTERLQGKEHQIAELKESLEKGTAEIFALRSDLKTESEKRSAAEEKNSRIAELEGTIKEREEELRRLYDENTAVKTKSSELSTIIVEERKATEEKLAVLDAAHIKLADAFKALSAEAPREKMTVVFDAPYPTPMGLKVTVVWLTLSRTSPRGTVRTVSQVPFGVSGSS